MGSAKAGLTMKRLSIHAVCFAAGLLAVSASGSYADPVARLAGQSDSGWTFTLPAQSYGPPDASRLVMRDVATHLNLFDGVGLDFGANADLAGRFGLFGGTSANDGLFFSDAAVNSPYASLANEGAFVSATIALADDLHFSFGAASLSSGHYAQPTSAFAAVARLGGAPLSYDMRSANSLLAGASWNFARWGGIGLVASQTSERNGLLGLANENVQSATTTAFDVSAHVGLGGGWVTTASFSQGITKLDLKTGFVAPGDDMPVRSYGIAVAKHGLFGNDALGVAVSRPDPNSSGFATVAGASMPAQFFGRDHLLEGQTPETDFELGYVTTFLDGAVALQTNADYQMNFAGQNGTNAVSLLSRAKIKF